MTVKIKKFCGYKDSKIVNSKKLISDYINNVLKYKIKNIDESTIKKISNDTNNSTLVSIGFLKSILNKYHKISNSLGEGYVCPVCDKPHYSDKYGKAIDRVISCWLYHYGEV